LQWFGGSLSGPVVIPKVYNGKNKTFFMGTWEHRTFPLAAGNTSTGTTTLPTDAFNAGNFAALYDPINGPIQLTNPLNGQPVPNNNLLAAGLPLSSVSSTYATSYYPKPNYSGTSSNPNNFQNNYRNTTSSPEHIDRYDIRIDQNIGSKDILSGRFTRQLDPWLRTWNAPVPGYNFQQVRNGTNTFLSETHTFTPVLLNEFRVGYQRDASYRTPEQDGNAYLENIGLVLGGVTVPPGTPGVPYMDISGGFWQLYPNPIQKNISEQYELMDNVSWTKGRHALKMGVLERYNKPLVNYDNNQFGHYRFNGQYTGFGYADFMLGYPSEVDLQGPGLPRYNRSTDTGLYINDTWSVNSKLTLTLGLRWEYFMPPVDNNDRRVNWNPATQAVVVPAQSTLQFLAVPQDIPIEVSPAGFPGRSLMYGDHKNFGPRVGMAYRFNDKTVFRGGYGVYYGKLTSSYQDNFGPDNQDAFSAQSLRLYNTTPVPTLQFPNPFGSDTLGSVPCEKEADCGMGITGTYPHLKTPMIQQWNATVERDLGRSMVARVSYRGMMTTQLPVKSNVNLPPASSTDQSDVYMYPQWTTGTIWYTTSGAIQKGNAFDASLNRRFAQGLMFQLAYTYTDNMTDSTASNDEIGYVSNPYDRHYDWGHNTLIPAHRFVPTMLWTVPYGPGQRWGGSSSKAKNMLLGGWEFSVLSVIQSGRFFSPIYDGTSWLQARNGSANRPDCVSGQDAYTGQSGWAWENSAYLNKAAFSKPADGMYGNCPAASLVGPAGMTFNVGVHKGFKLAEKANLKLEANFMNVFNHPNKNLPSNDWSASDFGQLSGTVSGNQLLNPTATNNQGERHIWIGARIEF